MFRRAEEKDIPIVAQWIEAFSAEAVPHDPPPEGKAMAEERTGSGVIHVLEKNDQLLAMTGWGRDIRSSCSVNLVYTSKEFRGNGYASLVTAKLTQLLLQAGRHETNLFTDMTNTTSNKIYKQIEYEFLGRSIHFGICSDHFG